MIGPDSVVGAWFVSRRRVTSNSCSMVESSAASGGRRRCRSVARVARRLWITDASRSASDGRRCGMLPPSLLPREHHPEMVTVVDEMDEDRGKEE